jgi:hypothetical protein
MYAGVVDDVWGRVVGLLSMRQLCNCTSGPVGAKLPPADHQRQRAQTFSSPPKLFIHPSGPLQKQPTLRSKASKHRQYEAERQEYPLSEPR